MVCPYCGGYMVYEKSYENNEPLCSWRCILCGEYMDDVIMENRLLQELKRQRSKKIPNASKRFKKEDSWQLFSPKPMSKCHRPRQARNGSASF